jgi:hypothetical protein
MTTRQKLIDRLADLQQGRAEAFANGDWDRVDFIQLCLDDTRDELDRLKAIERARNTNTK